MARYRIPFKIEGYVEVDARNPEVAHDIFSDMDFDETVNSGNNIQRELDGEIEEVDDYKDDEDE